MWLLTTELPSWLTYILGPAGLTVFLAYLWHLHRKDSKEQSQEIRELHDQRRLDLVSGMKYREDQIDKQIAGDRATQESMGKLAQALNEFARAQEKTNESVAKIAGQVEALAEEMRRRND